MNGNINQSVLRATQGESSTWRFTVPTSADSVTDATTEMLTVLEKVLDCLQPILRIQRCEVHLNKYESDVELAQLIDVEPSKYYDLVITPDDSTNMRGFVLARSEIL